LCLTYRVKKPFFPCGKFMRNTRGANSITLCIQKRSITMPKNFYTYMPSPLGKLLLTSHGDALTGLYTPLHRAYSSACKGMEDEAPFLQAIHELKEYFAGNRVAFSIPLAPQGTPFQQ